MSGDNTFLRQMSAIIGKMLSDLEEIEGVQEMHPMEFDNLRRRCIKASWDCFAVGRTAGISEAEDEVHTD